MGASSGVVLVALTVLEPVKAVLAFEIGWAVCVVLGRLFAQIFGLDLHHGRSHNTVKTLVILAFVALTRITPLKVIIVEIATCAV